MQENMNSEAEHPCLSRRRFLLMSGGVTVSTILLASCNKSDDGDGEGEGQQALVAGYARKKIATLGELQTDEPAPIFYPYDNTDLNSLGFIVKLGTPAGGGVGPASDIVAFSSLCTHVGGDLSDTKKTYMKEHKILGPCPLHLTTFDLTRHGMVVAGHATESLPQIVLEVDGDDVYAIGVLGLIYGKRDNADLPIVI